MIHVQFADDTESGIVSYFPCPQDPKVFQHLGVVEASDPRWHAYYEQLADAGLPLEGVPAPE